MRSKRIKTLEVVRTLAFCGIFLNHVGVSAFKGLGSWSVSVFLVMAGFVSTLKTNEIVNPSIKNNFCYLVRKIKNFYYIHILTSLLTAISLLFGKDTEPINEVIKKILANVFMLQTWNPMHILPLNGTSWFLCVLCLFYFLYPWYYKKIKNKNSIKTAKKRLITLFFMQIILMYIIKVFLINNYDYNYLISNQIFKNRFYFHPLIRIFDILIGCNLGMIYIQNKNTIIKNPTMYELISIVICMFAVIAITLIENNYKFICTRAQDRFMIYQFFLIPSSCFLIYISSLEQGLFFKLLINTFQERIANLSKYAFIIHPFIFLCIDFIYLLFIKINGNGYNISTICLLKLTVGFIITLYLSQIYTCFIEKHE